MKKIIFLILFFEAEESGVKVDKDVEKFMTVYCEYWSDGDYPISEIYETPFTLYNQDNTKVMKTEADS